MIKNLRKFISRYGLIIGGCLMTTIVLLLNWTTLASLFWPVVVAEVLDVQIDTHIVNTHYSGTVEQKDYIFSIRYDHENIFYQNSLYVSGAHYSPEIKTIRIKMNPTNPEEIESYYVRWDYIFIFLLLGLFFIFGGIIKLFQN